MRQKNRLIASQSYKLVKINHPPRIYAKGRMENRLTSGLILNHCVEVEVKSESFWTVLVPQFSPWESPSELDAMLRKLYG